MSPPGYQAPVVKASRCRNERQERSVRRKAGRKGSGEKKPEAFWLSSTFCVTEGLIDSFCWHHLCSAKKVSLSISTGGEWAASDKVDSGSNLGTSKEHV